MPSYAFAAGVVAQVGFAYLFSVTTVHAQDAKSKPGTVFRDCANCPEMVVIPAGSFMMGSPESEEGHQKNESPQHRVTIAHPFAVAKFELTRGEYGEFIRESGHDPGNNCAVWFDAASERAEKFGDNSGKTFDSDTYHRIGVQGYNWKNPNYAQTDRDPVVCVNWADTKVYIAWLSKKTGKTYRLLSEAEWEYAARAGTSTPYTFGSNPEDACRFGNVADLTAKEEAPRWTTFVNCRDGHGKGTAPVGSYQPNAFGLFDMIGNVFERVEDCYHDSYTGAPSDGSAWPADACERHVARGGGWLNTPAVFRAAERVMPHDDYRTSGTGIRLARTLE